MEKQVDGIRKPVPRSLAKLAALVLGAAFLLLPLPGRAVPMPACAEKLLQCGGDAAKTIGQSALTVGSILGHIVANADCAAAMASGSPVTIGVTGLVVGMGSAGVIHPESCETDIYGVALKPLSAGLGAVLQRDLLSEIGGQGNDAAKALISQIPVPALPPSVGGLIGCGCGALEAGAHAVEDVRKVAKFAAATYESCGAAVNACPGLKQAVAVLKAAYQVVSDPSSIVQSCDSMSRRQYVDARLRDLIQPTVDQFRNNIAWSGSNIEQNHWIPRKNTCYKYYDSHCYKESDARDFCNGPVWDENFDPEVWAAITAEFNGPQFDLYWKANVAKVAPKAVCPADPGGGINIDPNVIGAIEQKKAAQSVNAKACQATMAQLVAGDTDSMRTFAHDLLPTTREGWNNDVRLKQTEKPLDNAKKVFLRAMTAAAVVTKYKMEQAQTKYAAEDTAIANSGDLAAVPYVVLNRKYGEWAAIIAGGIKDGCPKDPNGYEKTYDLQCVKDVAASVGMNAQDTATIKLDGQITGVIQANIASGSFAGSPYYNTARDMLVSPNPPMIRVPGESAEKRSALYLARWPSIENKISAQFVQNLPALLGKAFERVEAEKTARKQQDASFAALAANNKMEADYALTVCDKAKGEGGATTPKSIECRNKVGDITKSETTKFGVSQYKVFPGGFNPAKPAPEAAMTAAVADIKRDHDTALKNYDAIYRDLNVNPVRILLKDAQANAKANGGAVAKLAEQDEAARQQQAKTLAALAAQFGDDSQRATKACAKAAAPRVQACAAEVDKVGDAEAAAVKGSLASVFGTPARLLTSIEMNNATRGLNLRHEQTMKDYRDLHTRYSVSADWNAAVAPVQKGVGVEQLSAGLQSTPPAGVAVSGLVAGRVAVSPGVAGNAGALGSPQSGAFPPVAGNTPMSVPGPMAGSQALAVVPPAPAGRIGMPALPTMGMLPAPKAPTAGQIPGTIAPAVVPPPATPVAMPPAGNTGAGMVLSKQAPVPGAIPGAVPGLMPGTTPSPSSPPVAVALPPAGNSGAGMILNKQPPAPGAVPGVAAVLAPPFDARAFRLEREKAIGDEWLPQCKGSAACRQGMTVLTNRRIDGEVQALTAGSPDYKNKAAVAAFIDKVDTQFDPQFTALIPKPAVVAMPVPVPPVPVGTPPPKPPPKIQKIPGL